MARKINAQKPIKLKQGKAGKGYSAGMMPDVNKMPMMKKI